MPPTCYQNIEFTSCYSHWKITPKGSTSKKSGKCNQSVESMKAQNLDYSAKFNYNENMILSGPRPPKFKKKKANKKKLMANKNNSRCSSPIQESSPVPVSPVIAQETPHLSQDEEKIHHQINFMDASDDFKPKDDAFNYSVNASKKPVWTTMPLVSNSVPNSQAQISPMLLQQILQDQKRIDDNAELHARAALEASSARLRAGIGLYYGSSLPPAVPAPVVPPIMNVNVNVNTNANATHPSRFKSSGIASFPLSRIPSLEKLQFTMQLTGNGSSTAGHNFSAFMPTDPMYQYNAAHYYSSERTTVPLSSSFPINPTCTENVDLLQPIPQKNNVQSHIPLSSGRTTSLEKFLSYWQDCDNPIDHSASSASVSASTSLPTSSSVAAPNHSVTNISSSSSALKNEKPVDNDFTSPLEELCLEKVAFHSQQEQPNFDEFFLNEENPSSCSSLNSSTCSTPNYSDYPELEDVNYWPDESGNEDFLLTCQSEDKSHSQADLYFVDQVLAI